MVKKGTEDFKQTVIADVVDALYEVAEQDHRDGKAGHVLLSVNDLWPTFKSVLDKNPLINSNQVTYDDYKTAYREITPTMYNETGHLSMLGADMLKKINMMKAAAKLSSALSQLLVKHAAIFDEEDDPIKL